MSPSPHAESPWPPPGGGRRALVVEDNAGDRWFYSELLRKRGYAVRSVESGEDALAAFREEPAPLVLVDHVLPGMDGAELCRRIRREAGGSEAILLAVTGRDDAVSLAEVLEAGADDFVRKPVPPELFAVRVEIAERRMADRALRRETEARLEFTTRELEQLFRSLPEVFFSVEMTQGRLHRISRSSEALFGHTAAALAASRPLWRTFLFPEEGGESAWVELARSEPGRRVVREYPVVRPDGSSSWVRASASVERDPASGEARAYGLVVDITDEWQARAALAHRNRELAALYRVSELTLDAEAAGRAYDELLAEVARIMEVPVVLLEELDRSADRLLLVGARGMAVAEDAPAAVPLHQTPAGVAVQTGRPLLDPDPRTRRDLTHGPLAALQPRFWASFPLIAGGAVTGTLTLVDRAPRSVDGPWVELGERLAMALAAYMERVEAEDALRESEGRHRTLAAQLARANQELEAFAYSVSHDLRAPLRTMQGFAHALLQNFGDVLPEGAQDYARRIIASGRQSERLITDLLAYSRLSFEKLEVKPVEMAGVVAQVLEQIRADLEEARARVDVAHALPTVLGNPTTLLQVVSNLVSNAVKFVPGDRRPRVRIHAEDRGDFVRVWVEDNGIGIPAGQEERIFRVFERLAEGGSHPGTGIGLAIARRGMERIGGRCGVERLREEGSAFWIEALKAHPPAARGWGRRKRGG